MIARKQGKKYSRSIYSNQRIVILNADLYSKMRPRNSWSFRCNASRFSFTPRFKVHSDTLIDKNETTTQEHPPAVEHKHRFTYIWYQNTFSAIRRHSNFRRDLLLFRISGACATLRGVNPLFFLTCLIACLLCFLCIFFFLFFIFYIILFVWLSVIWIVKPWRRWRIETILIACHRILVSESMFSKSIFNWLSCQVL